MSSINAQDMISKIIGTGFLIFSIICLTRDVLQSQDTWRMYTDQQADFQKKAMVVLGSWGIANVISGGIGMATTDGVARNFNQMNAGWGAINAGIAFAGYLGSQRLRKSDVSGMGLLKKNQALSKSLVFNAGLDIGYIVGGFYFRERALNDQAQADRWKGFGNSLILQGTFLFTFDLLAYLLNARNTQAINETILELGIKGQGIGLKVTF